MLSTPGDLLSPFSKCEISMQNQGWGNLSSINWFVSESIAYFSVSLQGKKGVTKETGLCAKEESNYLIFES